MNEHSPATLGIMLQPADFMPTNGAIMGRQSATVGFVHALLHYTSFDQILCFLKSAQQERDAHTALNSLRPVSGKKAPHHEIVLPADYHRLNGCDVFFTPDPNIALHAQRRIILSKNRTIDNYSLAGVIHTIASKGAMDLITQLPTCPVAPWDALVCTSTSGQKVVKQLIENQRAYLQDAGILTPACPVQLPVIPLGVDCARFDPTSPLATRARVAWRQRLGIGEHDIAILYFGRLSFHAKANPFVLFTALQCIAEKNDIRLHLLMVGNFSNSKIQYAYQDAAKSLCPSVRTLFLKGTHEGVSNEIWFGADIFTSLSDNIQETFGLTPIEAMAAGLPAVVSDWNGYKDTVIHTQTGFRIPTYFPSPGAAGRTLADRYHMEVDSYDDYVGNISKATTVDLPSLISALEALIVNPRLRKEMGQCGRTRALQHFDWRHVISSYDALWQELNHIRTTSGNWAPTPASTGSEHFRLTTKAPDPFALFGSYPTIALDELRLRRSTRTPRVSTDEALSLGLFNFGIRQSSTISQSIMEALADKTTSLPQLRCTSGLDEPELTLTIAWLLKAGFIEADHTSVPILPT